MHLTGFERLHLRLTSEKKDKVFLYNETEQTTVTALSFILRKEGKIKGSQTARCKFYLSI